MTATLPGLIDAFAGLRVLVVGDALLDCYLDGPSDRLCREAPVPVVAVSRRRCQAGGAANTAVNVRALGADVAFVSLIGTDGAGRDLRDALLAAGVPTDGLVERNGRSTLVKHRLLSGGQLLARFDQGDTAPMDADAEAELIALMTAAYTSCDAVIVADYACGTLTPGIIAALADVAARTPRIIVVDAKRPERLRALAATAVKPNFAETLGLLDAPGPAATQSRARFVEANAHEILDRTGARIAAVTLDADGAVIIERGRPIYRTFARPVANLQAVGAGDTYVAVLALALAAGADAPAAAELASAAARLAVAAEGTACCSADELRLAVSDDEKLVQDVGMLAARIEAHRRRGRRIVFTNGCFDILHRGHVTFLARAKALGDVLVVGVNSDQSVRRLKGRDKGMLRPVVPLEDRLALLAALSGVDLIVPFEDDTARDLIEAIRPDVYAKGGDHARESLPEAPLVERLGGTVRILPYIRDHSVTGIIERVRSLGDPLVRSRVASSDVDTERS